MAETVRPGIDEDDARGRRRPLRRDGARDALAVGQADVSDGRVDRARRRPQRRVDVGGGGRDPSVRVDQLVGVKVSALRAGRDRTRQGRAGSGSITAAGPPSDGPRRRHAAGCLPAGWRACGCSHCASRCEGSADHPSFLGARDARREPRRHPSLQKAEGGGIFRACARDPPGRADGARRPAHGAAVRPPGPRARAWIGALWEARRVGPFAFDRSRCGDRGGPRSDHTGRGGTDRPADRGL